jgi:uncharacterized protein (UPF0248 family)
MDPKHIIFYLEQKNKTEINICGRVLGQRVGNTVMLHQGRSIYVHRVSRVR